jgi:Trypsin-like peptidase domain
MRLSEDTQRRLAELVRETTALVYVAGRPIGTAFFIGEDLLLTCAHVGVTDTVTIQPYQRECRPAMVDGRAEPDLALLRSPPDGGKPSPCVVLGQALDSYDCLVAGYPRMHGADPGSEVRSGGVHLRKNLTGGDQSLVIDPGQNITWGMSGGPVISTGSGAVIAIVRTSKDPEDAQGGGAIPISLAVEAFSQVREALGGETRAMIPWRDVLGQENWQLLGRSWDIAERIDLQVTGDRTHWEVRLHHAGGPEILHKGPDLGDGVAKAIFHWAQRRHVRGADEVRLLGQLLARALFPNPIPPQLDALRRADSVLVCLHVEAGNDLADVPWELAADPFPHKAEPFFDEPDWYLAADRPFRFTRILAERAESVSAPKPKPPASIRVLTVVAQPKGWLHQDIPRPSGRGHPWPDAPTMLAGLKASIRHNGLTVTSLASPTRGDMQEALETAHENQEPYDVLHYMGTGKLGSGGQAQIVFVDDSNPHSELEEWEDVHRILGDAARADVRLVVLELMLPPENEDLQQLICSAFGDVVKDSVKAVVLTNHPVYPDQCQVFNREFYRFLSGGESIEKAVQEARHRLKVDKPTGDAAGFGWFTVVTGRQVGIRLVAPPPRDPTLSGARATGEPPADGTGDVFHR